MDKKNILTEHTFRNNTFLCQIRERIENRKEWLDYFAACLKHQEISDKVSKEFYYDKPITSFILTSGLLKVITFFLLDGFSINLETSISP